MKIKKFLKKYQLVLWLSFTVVVLSGIKILYKPDWSNYSTVQIEPTTTPTPILGDDYPMQNILPYVGKNFDIEKYESPMTLLVKVKIMDQKLVEEEMIELFQNQGIDINSHKFDWQQN